MGLDINKDLHFLSKGLEVFEKRTELISNNIANRDTPGYVSKDIDFRKALSSIKSESQMDQKSLNKINKNQNFDGFMITRSDQIPSFDGHKINSHKEQAEFSENSIRYMANLKFLGSKIESMLAAIRGGR